MPNANDLTTAIQQAAGDPSAVTSDGISVTARPVADLIAADQYLAGKVAAKQRRRGITFTKLVTPGAVSDNGMSLGGTTDFGTGGY